MSDPSRLNSTPELGLGFKGLSTFLCLCFSLILGISEAQTLEEILPDAETSNQQISSAIKQFTDELLQGSDFSRIETDINTPDPRLKLSLCITPLTVESKTLRRKFGRLTLNVQCNDEISWSVYVPIEIKAFDEVVITTRPISRGALVQRDQVTIEEQNVASLHQGYYRDISSVVGTIAKRSIPGNRVLNPGKLSPPRIVNKGERVTIVASSGSVNIRATGEALSDGVLGQLVQVRNTSSNRVIEGRVTAAGQISVSM